MDQWAQHPQAETTLSNILPCVDESTTNRTLYQSKEVVVRIVGIVNRAISALSNRRLHHKHPRQFMPYLCSPYDSNLNDRPCKYREVTFENATTVSFGILSYYFQSLSMLFPLKFFLLPGSFAFVHHPTGRIHIACLTTFSLCRHG